VQLSKQCIAKEKIEEQRKNLAELERQQLAIARAAKDLADKLRREREEEELADAQRKKEERDRKLAEMLAREAAKAEQDRLTRQSRDTLRIVTKKWVCMICEQVNLTCL
jgi:hypothetical protein